MKLPEGKLPIKVFIRIRQEDDVLEYDNNTIKICNAKNIPIEYGFDRVFGPEEKTKSIFKEINQIIKSTDNHNVSVIAYGQTGSGKTYTMNGSPNSPGIIPLILKELLDSSHVFISFLEIYNEKIIDLLDGKEKQLREDHGAVFVQDIISKTVTNIKEFNVFNELALRNRKTGETKLNKCSSRSHMIVQVKTEVKTIHMVDLAGSENNKKAGNEGLRMEESSNINSSLFALNKVVNAILNKELRIPYRDSKLTRLLQNSIGGTGRCFIIATVINSVECTAEIINTLNFASKSKKISNKTLNATKIPKNESPDLFQRLHSKHFIKVSPPKVDPFLSKVIKFSDKRNTQNAEFIKQTKMSKIPVNSKNYHLNSKIHDPRNRSSEIKEELAENGTNINDRISNKYSSAEKRLHEITNRSTEGSSSTLKNSFLNKNNVEMTPITKQKSLDYFMKAAINYEAEGDLKRAIDTYKTIKKFADTEEVSKRLKEIQFAIKKEKDKISARDALQILNSGDFLEVKKLAGVGDKRAQIIIDFIKGGNYFESLEDLKMVFSDKIVNNIVQNITG